MNYRRVRRMAGDLMKLRLEEIEGTPRAIFEDEDPLRGEMLSHFLHPAPYFVPDMLYEITLVERNATASSGFDTPHVCVEFFRDRVVIEKWLAEHEDGEDPPQVILSLDEAKLLLLEWGVMLQRRQIELIKPGREKNRKAPLPLKAERGVECGHSKHKEAS